MIHQKHFTLSHRLLVALGVVSFLFWAVMATLSTRDNIGQVNELYDVHLAHTAKAFLHLMDPDDKAEEIFPSTMSAAAIEQLFESWPDLPERPQFIHRLPGDPTPTAPLTALPLPAPTGKPLGSNKAKYGNSLHYQLWRDDGTLLFRTDNAPLTKITNQTGFSDSVDAQGKGWRNYNVYDRPHGVNIIVSEPHEFRAQLVRSMVLSTATPLALGLPVLFLLLWFSIRNSLRPLAALSQEITKRQPDNLSPIDEASVPDEVQPIVTALNDLLKRMGQTLENERRFTDDAAHQLRTPLAAIQAQLYTARNTQTGQAHQQALDQLQQSVARGIRLVNQLLALARLDPRQASPQLQPVNLGEVAESVCAELAALALQRDQTLELQAPPGLPLIHGHADMLSMLISNLVDNAIHYTDRGGHVTISLEPTRTGVQLAVCDDGPGIATEQRERVFERFYRVAQQSQPGTGLGLAICKRVAELHHTSLKLSDGLQGRGLAVRVDFAA